MEGLHSSSRSFRLSLHPVPDALARPAQRERLAEIRDNLTDRIAEAAREGWPGEIEGLEVSLAGAEDKLTQIARRPNHAASVDLGIPTWVPQLMQRDRP